MRGQLASFAHPAPAVVEPLVEFESVESGLVELEAQAERADQREPLERTLAWFAKQGFGPLVLTNVTEVFEDEAWCQARPGLVVWQPEGAPLPAAGIAYGGPLLNWLARL